MNIRFFLLSLVFVPALCWGQLSLRLSTELQAKTLTASADELIPVIIALQDPVERDVVARRISTLKSVESQRKMVMRELSNARLGGLNTVASLLEVASQRKRSTNIHKMVVGNLITCSVSPAVLKQLQQHPLVKWVDVDHKSTMNIPEKNIKEIPLTPTTTPAISWNVDFIEATRVWSEYGITGKGIVVAVLDSGVDYNHPNLQGNMWQSAEYPHHGWDFVDNDNDPMDENRHGTHCAGTIAGNRTGAIFCGVAPDATIMIVRVLDAFTAGVLSNVLQGVDFAVRNNADIISASLGFANLPLQTRNTVREIFDDLALFNIPAIIAAGNEGKNINGTHNKNIDQIDNIPGAIPSPWIAPESQRGGTSSVITIGASDNMGLIAEFSSIGPAFWETAPYADYPLALKTMEGLIKPDIVAPGTDIPSLNFKTTGYATMNGTSMATPCVAGVTALLLQSNPKLSIAQIDRILQNTATKHTRLKNNVYGSGVVNAYAAVSATKLSVPTRLWVEVKNEECTLSWEAPEKKSGLTGYQIYGDNNKLAQISANNLEYKFTTNKSHKTYHITALYGTTESLASNSIRINDDLCTPFNMLSNKSAYNNSVDLKWQTPYENIIIDWGSMSPALWEFEDIQYYRIRFDKDKFKEIERAKLKIQNVRVYTNLQKKDGATIILINGGKVLSTQKVVIGENGINEIIEVDLSSIKDQFDSSLETFVEVHTSVTDPIRYTNRKFVAGVNYYSLDGKEWKEVDREGMIIAGNFMISLGFQSPLKSQIGSMRKPLGYNIYQNGIKINETPVMGNRYNIRNVPEGKHIFAVSSTIDGRESDLSFESSYDLEYSPVLEPTPTIANIIQKSGDVHIYIENAQLQRSNATIYQDGVEVESIRDIKNNSIKIVNAPVGAHKYMVEIRYDNKLGTSPEKQFVVEETLMAPKNVSATLSSDTTLLSWEPAISFIRHHNDVGPFLDFYAPSTSPNKHYVATTWSAEKLKPVEKQQLKGINVLLKSNMDSIHLYIYKNEKLCYDQPVVPESVFEHTIELKTPITVNAGDSLFVAFLIHSKGTSAFYDRSKSERPEDNLFSVDGVNWEPLSKYSTPSLPLNLNWHVTLRFGEEATQVDLNALLPSYFRVNRNGKFAGLLSGSSWKFSEKLPSYDNYVYTVESIYKGPQTRMSSEVTVNYSPTSVEKVKSSSSVFVSGSEIIISNASGDGTLFVFNTEGKQMLVRSVNKGRNVIQTKLPAGVYIVKLSINQTEESVKISII